MIGEKGTSFDSSVQFMKWNDMLDSVGSSRAKEVYSTHRARLAKQEDEKEE